MQEASAEIKSHRNRHGSRRIFRNDRKRIGKGSKNQKRNDAAQRREKLVQKVIQRYRFSRYKKNLFSKGAKAKQQTVCERRYRVGTQNQRKHHCQQRKVLCKINFPPFDRGNNQRFNRAGRHLVGHHGACQDDKNHHRKNHSKAGGHRISAACRRIVRILL